MSNTVCFGKVRYLFRPVLAGLHYRTEVEEVVAETVASQADIPSNLRESIRNAVIRALESDASWVQLYEGTGEIHIQDAHQAEENIAEFYSKVKRVMIVARLIRSFGLT